MKKAQIIDSSLGWMNDKTYDNSAIFSLIAHSHILNSQIRYEMHILFRFHRIYRGFSSFESILFILFVFSSFKLLQNKKWFCMYFRLIWVKFAIQWHYSLTEMEALYGICYENMNVVTRIMFGKLHEKRNVWVE